WRTMPSGKSQTPLHAYRHHYHRHQSRRHARQRVTGPVGDLDKSQHEGQYQCQEGWEGDDFSPHRLRLCATPVGIIARDKNTKRVQDDGGTKLVVENSVANGLLPQIGLNEG